jgi:nitric oxide reductase subunit B
MENKKYALWFIKVALVCLLLGVLCGLISGFQYVMPTFIKAIIPFSVWRPLHTLLVVAWILLAAIGGIYYYLEREAGATSTPKRTIQWHFWVFVVTGMGIILSYFTGHFQGKEYLEFPHGFYIPIILGWVLFGVYYFSNQRRYFAQWPVYKWMWATGIVGMIFHLTEAHLWILPYFKAHFLQNIALQWKAGGSYVGSWNMLVYGTSIYVMAKISGTDHYARSPKAFFFYFLGLTNLMFGWAHHIYVIPTAPWIRYVAYGISMTEWILLISMIYDWKKSLSTALKTQYAVAYNIMLLADLWVFLNLILALLLSIPAINLFTHGTHITVAHSMGTTIGINTLILLSSLVYLNESKASFSEGLKERFKKALRVFNGAFIGFWCCLLIMGVKRSHWTYGNDALPFSKLQESLHWMNVGFVFFGFLMFVGLYWMVKELWVLLKKQ